MFSSFAHLSLNIFSLLLRQELSLSKSKSHECELSGASREEMMMLGEVGMTTIIVITMIITSSSWER